MKKLASAVLLAILLAACGPTTETDQMMAAWAKILNAHLATGGDNLDYSYPANLGQIDPQLATGLSEVDAWGQKFLYRRIRDDKYQLISAGPDGEYGNEDDLVVENGVTYDPVKIYKKRPLKKP